MRTTSVLHNFRCPSLIGILLTTLLITPITRAENAVCNAKNLRIREKPAVSGKVVGQLTVGEQVIVVAKTEFTQEIDGKQSAWYQIMKCTETAGWVFGAYLQFKKAAPSGEFQWKEITRKNFWGHPGIFATPYDRFSNVKFSYPALWRFSCCNDGDYRSSHTIFSSEDFNTAYPFIVIWDHVFSFDDLMKRLPKNIEVEDRYFLNNLCTDSYVYKTVTRDGIKRKSYIFKTDGVVEVSFYHCDLLGDEFIEDFLGRIEIDN